MEKNTTNPDAQQQVQPQRKRFHGFSMGLYVVCTIIAGNN